MWCHRSTWTRSGAAGIGLVNVNIELNAVSLGGALPGELMFVND